MVRRLALALCVVSLAPACSSKTKGRDDASLPPPIDAGTFDVGPPPPDTGPPPGDAGPDAPVDAGPRPPDGGPIDLCSTTCGPTELCGDMGDGDGLDNDCDGSVDEDCTCVPMTSRGCFVGPPERRGLGLCAEGVMGCNEFGVWSACTGGNFGSDETCNGADDDCDGVRDDGLAGCATSLACPGAEVAYPLRAHPLRASTIYTMPATAWRWTVTCPSTVATCPMPADPTAQDTEIFFIASGNYRVRLEITAMDGTMLECEWIVHVAGSGLRVELNWDTQGIGRGNTDVDLHLHRRSVPPDMLIVDTPFFTHDDCFFLNCKATTYYYDDFQIRRRWMLMDTADLAFCQDAPQGEGGYWVAEHMACFNPRLDVDVITCDPAETDSRAGSFCAPENINVDEPAIGDTFRVMVNYYSDHGFTGTTYPTVNIYCNGELRGAFGSDPIIELDEGSTLPRNNDNWMVADVKFFLDSCGRVECMVNPLFLVTNTGDFGPVWSF